MPVSTTASRRDRRTWIAATIGSAVYSYYLKVTGDRVAAAQALATARIGIAQTRVRQAHVEVDTDPEDADHQLAEAEEDLAEARAALEEPEPEPVPGGWREVLEKWYASDGPGVYPPVAEPNPRATDMALV